MSSHGTVQGNKGQATVDSKHQGIVHCEAIGKGLDNDNLPPVAYGAKQNLESIHKLISQGMVKKIETQKRRKIYPLLIGIVEPVFANIRVHTCMHKINLRGKIKVNIQWLLYCMVHNIEKAANHGFR